VNLQHTTFPTQPRAPTQTWARARTRAAIRSQPAVIVMAAAALAVTLVSQPGTARAEGGGPEPVPPFGVCPHAEVRAFFSGPGDPLSDQPIADRLAIEEQVLTLCLERQTLIRQVYEQDRAIAELRQPEVDANTRDLPPAIPEAAQTRNIGLDNTPSTGLLAPATTNQPPEQTGTPVAQAQQTDSTAQTTADRRPAPRGSVTATTAGSPPPVWNSRAALQCSASPSDPPVFVSGPADRHTCLPTKTPRRPGPLARTGRLTRDRPHRAGPDSTDPGHDRPQGRGCPGGRR